MIFWPYYIGESPSDAKKGDIFTTNPSVACVEKKVLKVRGGDANMLGKMSHCHPLWHCRDIFLTFNIITNIKISFPLGFASSSHSTSSSISTSTSRCPQPCPWPWCEVLNTPPTCFWNTSSFCYSTDLSSRPTKIHPHTNTH